MSLHNPSFGTITGSQDPSRIVDLAERFILVYSLSLSGPLRCLFRLGQGYVCSCNTTYVLLQHTICALATHRMFSWMTPYGSMELERFWLDPPSPLFSNYNEKMHFGMDSYVPPEPLQAENNKSIMEIIFSDVSPYVWFIFV